MEIDRKNEKYCSDFKGLAETAKAALDAAPNDYPYSRGLTLRAYNTAISYTVSPNKEAMRSPAVQVAYYTHPYVRTNKIKNNTYNLACHVLIQAALINTLPEGTTYQDVLSIMKNSDQQRKLAGPKVKISPEKICVEVLWFSVNSGTGTGTAAQPLPAHALLLAKGHNGTTVVLDSYASTVDDVNYSYGPDFTIISKLKASEQYLDERAEKINNLIGLCGKSNVNTDRFANAWQEAFRAIPPMPRNARGNDQIRLSLKNYIYVCDKATFMKFLGQLHFVYHPDIYRTLDPSVVVSSRPTFEPTQSMFSQKTTEKVEKKLTKSEVIGNMNRMGIKLLKENDFTQAEKCFVTVLEYWRAHKPEHRKNLQGALFNLGTTLFKSGELNNSSTILESAKIYLIEARNLEDLSGNNPEVKYAIRLADCESAITALRNEHQNPVNNLRS
jgi:hypothetical protein